MEEKSKSLSTTKAQHVFPRSNGLWSVRSTGAKKPARSFDTKDEAVGYARTRAKKSSSVLYIHRRDGMITSSAAYGEA